MADDKAGSDDYEKPDPNEYKIQMREVRESDALRHDDFVGSYDKTGRVKLENKRWQPKKPVESTRVDDWVGGAQKPQRTWRVKTAASASSGLKSDSYSDEEDARKKAQSAKPSRAASDFGTSPRRWKPPPKNEGIPPPWMASAEPERRASTMPKWKPKGSTSKVSQAAAQVKEEDEAASDGERSPAKAKASDRMCQSHSALNYNNEDDDRVDPAPFKQMYKTHNSESNRNEGFVTDFSNTGRIKVSPRKSWQPTTTTKPERQEEWMGSPANQSRRSWQVKSSDKKKEKAPAPQAPDLDNSLSNLDLNDKDDSSAVEVDSDSEAQENEANEAEKTETQGRDDSSVVEVDSDNDEPPKEAEALKKEETKRAWASTSNLDHDVETKRAWASTSNLDHDDDKPDPNEYKIQMREVRESDALRHDDYVGSYDKTGRIKSEKKRWQPQKPVESTRVDDWLGSGKAPARRSWKVKSTSSVPKIEDPDSEEEAPAPAPKPVAAPAPAPAPKPVAAPVPAPAPEPEPEQNATVDEPASDDASANSEYEIDSDEEETPAAATVSDDEEPAEQESEQPKEDPETEDDDGRPDPKEFMQMRDANEAGGARLDDFVGSYNNTGRVKLDKKKWQPSKPVEKQHVDDWLGSGKQPRKASWKAK
jgi:hypothetical protein